ncbi:MAG: hypothetical protein ABIJ97_02385 [Bacteroidota bacterium]
MKNLDLVSKRIAVVSIAICGVLLTVSLLCFSIGSITKGYATDAKPTIQNATANTAVAGEIMMAPAIYGDGTFVILVWNTVTGKSVRYYLDTNSNPYKYVKNKVSLPENPFE